MNEATKKIDATPETGIDVDRTRTQSESKPAQKTTELPDIPGFVIEEVLGRGGMGVVFKAWQPSLKRHVALKMILGGEHANPQHLTRFRTEAQAVAQLHHPHIVQIYDIGEHQGQPFFCLEYVDAGSLAANLEHRPQPPLEAARLVEMLARASHYTHQRGIVHRDLKPSNVLLTKSDHLQAVPLAGVNYEPKIGDFGLAKLLTEDAGQTVSGAVIGTPSYMAPEQAAGQTNRIGPLVDVYALGVILYEMLTGKAPFRADSHIETLRRVMTEEATPPSKLQPAVPRDLETICLKAMAREPARRYASALALAQDLERFVAGEPILARRQGPVSRLWHKVRRHRWIALSASLVVVALAAVVYFFVTARTANQAADFTKQFEAKLQKLEWSEAYLREMDDFIAAIEPSDPQRARLAQAELYDRHFVESVRKALKPDTTLLQEDLPPIEAAINLVKDRRPALHTSLHKELLDRTGRRQTVREVKYPFNNLKETFGARAKLDGQSIVHVQRKADELTLLDDICQGSVQMEAVFAYPSWQSAQQLGVVLDCSKDKKRGYRFLLSSKPGPESKDPDLAPTSADGKTWRLLIVRDGIPLRQASLGKLANRAITLRATREGTLLTLQLFQRDAQVGAIRFQDTFPPAGMDTAHFALAWPAGIGLEELRVSRQTLPPQPGPMESADEAYAQGKLDKALDTYRSLSSDARRDLNQEARCKQALCLLDLKRHDEAETLLKTLVQEPGERWPLVAACRLWLVVLEKDHRKEADALSETLLARGFQPEQLAAVVPEKVRHTLFTSYKDERGHYHFFFKASADELRHAERAVAIRRFLSDNDSARFYMNWNLVRPYRLMKELDKASALLEKMLRDDRQGQSGFSRVMLVEESGWVAREMAQPGRVLPLLDTHLAQAEYDVLLVEKARMLSALGKNDEAGHTLDEFFRRHPTSAGCYPQFSAGCLMQGFLHEDKGDAAGALSWWKRGAAEVPTGLGGGITDLHTLVLASLANELTAADALRINDRIVATLPSYYQVALKTLDYKLPAGVLRDMWRNPRGRTAARKIAFQTASYREHLTLPLHAIVYTLIRNEALPAKISTEQEAVAWTLTQDVVDALATGKMTSFNAIQMATAWKGQSNFLGWAALSQGVDPSLRAHFAYVLGFRYERLKRGSPADMFRTAVREAPEGSTLRTLATRELERLQQKSP